jgi:hypothetical protein
VVGWGLQTAWRGRRWAGLAALFLALTYLIFNSLFRNSGGRYILPVDWSILLYFSIGLAQATQDLGRRLAGRPLPATAPAAAVVEAQPAASPARRAPVAFLAAAAALLLLGSLVPLTEAAFPERYTRERRDEMFNRLFEPGLLPREDRSALLTYLRRGAFATAGRALYPRYFAANVDDPGGRGEMFDAAPTPRLTFFLAGPVNGNMLLPIERKPNSFPNGADVLIITCPDLDILALALYAPDGTLQDIFLRSPFPQGKAICPLPVQPDGLTP